MIFTGGYGYSIGQCQEDICASWWEATPDTPIAPIILPSAIMGRPPSARHAPKVKRSQPNAATGERIFECFGRAAELNRSPCLGFGDPARGKRVRLSGGL